MGELTQVLTDDVQEIDGILCLIISATSGDGKRLKTEVSHRVILRQHHRRGDAFHWNVIEPVQTRMLEVNDWLGEEAVALEPFQPMIKKPASAAQSP